MKALDYSRELLKRANDLKSKGHKFLHDDLIRLVLPRAVKFMIPDYKILGIDGEFKQLEDMDRLLLPYPCMAIEFERPFKNAAGADVNGKCVVLAMQDGETINTVGTAMIGSEVYVDSINVIDPQILWGEKGKGYRDLRIIGVSKQGESMEIDVYATLGLLNILSCSNVSTKGEEPSRLKQQIAKDRGAMPYDTYHVLSIDSIRPSGSSGAGGGAHASPREHLRRGHIRRLQDGRRIWVNAAVVGSASRGRVHKDYALSGPPVLH